MGALKPNTIALDCMKAIHKSVLIWFSPQQMFDLVSAVQDYPQFMPWCDQAAVLQANDKEVTAKLGIAFAGIKQSFTTRNALNAPQEMHMSLVEGPFSHLMGHWQFQALPDPGACKIIFDLEYAFSSRTLEMLVGPVFDKITSTFVEAFIARAEKIHGPKG